MPVEKSSLSTNFNAHGVSPIVCDGAHLIETLQDIKNIVFRVINWAANGIASLVGRVTPPKVPTADPEPYVSDWEDTNQVNINVPIEEHKESLK